MKHLNTKMISIDEILEDYNLYPRHVINPVVVNEYVAAFEQGAKFPPIKVDTKTMRVVDGFHRIALYRKLKLTEINADLYEFKDDKELLWYAISWNSIHGQRLTRFDQARCIAIGRKVGLKDAELSEALSITLKRFEKITHDRLRDISVKGLKMKGRQKIFESTPVKRIISEATENTITKHQAEIQKTMGGMHAAYYIEQACLILENELLPVTELNINRAIKLNKVSEKWVKMHLKAA